MLKLIYGDDRVAAEAEVKKLLGSDYEVYEGENVTLEELPNLFQGTMLFETEKRKILLKNLSDNSVVWGELPKYLKTTHLVVIWELKVDKRLATYKALQNAGVEMKEFAIKKPNQRAIFGIIDMAYSDGERAVRRLEKIQEEQDPFMLMGLFVSQMLKRLSEEAKRDLRGGAREKKILKLMADVDLQMKSSKMDPWQLLKGMLMLIEKTK